MTSSFETRWRATELLATTTQRFGKGGDQLMCHVLAGFLPMAGSQPASERHHHSWPFGLVEHSLEVALGTFAAIADAARASDLVAPLVGPTLTVALLHDLGKVFDFDRSTQTWRPGRGFLGHPDQVGFMLFLTPEEWAAPVKSLADRYHARFRRPRLPEEPPLDYLVDAIARADGTSAWRGRLHHPERGMTLDQLLSSPKVAA